MSSHFDRLVAFYKHYDAPKAAANNVEAVLAKYQGREADMWAQLTAKYGPEPHNSCNSRDNSSSSISPVNVRNDSLAGSFNEAGGGYGSRQASLSPTSGPISPARGAGSSGDPNRDRLVRFYQHYDASKVANVDAVLQKYNTPELFAQMFVTLTGKYGPEPPAPAAAQAAPSVSPIPLLSPVNASLGIGAGAAAADCFSPQPGAPLVGDSALAPARLDLMSPQTRAAVVSHRERLTRFYEKWSPESLTKVDAILEKYAGKEDAMWQQLTAKYGPEPQSLSVVMAPPGDTRANLCMFYNFYDKAKCTEQHVAAAMKRFEGATEDMWLSLYSKYGDFPTPEEQQQLAQLDEMERVQRMQAGGGGGAGGAVASAASNPQTGQKPPLRKRLIRFYRLRAPNELFGSKVRQLMYKYENQEEELFKALVSKYGEEPPW